MNDRGDAMRGSPERGGAKAGRAARRARAALRRGVAIAEHPLVVGGLLAVAAGAVALAVMAPVRNGDLGWHLALGRWIAREGAIPSAEPFTWTARGRPMVAHEWLSQWLYWQVAEASGIRGLRALHAGLYAALVPGVFAVLRRSALPPALALLGTFAWLALAQGRFQVRPHLVNLLFTLALYGWLFVRAPRLDAWRIGACAGAVALWANLHSGAVLFPVLVALHGGAEAAMRALARWRGRAAPAWPVGLGRGDLHRMAALGAACALAVLATPNHVRLLPYLAASAAANRQSSWEWLSILRYVGHPDMAPHVPVLWAVLAVAASAAAVRAWRVRRGGGDGTLAQALAWLPLQSVRFLWLGFVPLAFVLREAAQAVEARGERGALALRAAALVALLALLPAVAWPPGGWRLAAERAARGPDLDPASFPIGAARLLSEVPLEGRLFARAEWGGLLTLLLDERHPTFADGRWVTIGPEIVRLGHRIATRRDDALRLAERLGIDLLLVERDWLRGPDDPALHGWLPAFASYNALLLLRRDARGEANRRRLAAYYAQHGIPFDPERGFDAQRAWRANRTWARAHRVGRRSVRHFDASGRHRGRGVEVTDWPPEPPASP